MAFNRCCFYVRREAVNRQKSFYCMEVFKTAPAAGFTVVGDMFNRRELTHRLLQWVNDLYNKALVRWR